MNSKQDELLGNSTAILVDGSSPPYADNIETQSKVNGEEQEDDPWVVHNLVVKSTPWHELSTGGRVKRVLWNYTCRQLVLLLLLYLFICSLDFLSSSFRLLGGKAAGEVFKDSIILMNPVAGLMIGVLATVLLQSSSTTTSIVVSMVGAGILEVNIAIPIVMGANIGTSVTNTIVSLGQVSDRNQFRRAFGGATVHDMFNWLSVLILLPLEVATRRICIIRSDKEICGGYLFHLSRAIMDTVDSGGETKNVKLLKAITEPFTKYIVKIDKNAIKDIAKGKIWNGTIIKKQKEGYMFENVADVWPDWVIGLILLLVSLVILCTCLVLLVKILNSIFKGPIAVLLKKFINSDVPGKFGRHFTGYIAIIIGALLTILVQSSSIFTSTLTPLVGIGVITLDRMYPLTLGANIGTTITAIIASLAQDDDIDSFKRSLQISMCHLFFNITGILIWYPIPVMRKLPLFLAKKLGDTTARYRWFAILYLILAFFVAPAIVFGLSAAGWIVAACVLIPIALIFIAIILINVLQSKKPGVLPRKLRDWDFLPAPLHSLEPYDRIFVRTKQAVRRGRSINRSGDLPTNQETYTMKENKL